MFGLDDLDVFVFAEFLVFVFCSNISCREKQKRCRDARMFVFCVFFAGVFLCLCFVLILVAGRCNAIEMQRCKNGCEVERPREPSPVPRHLSQQYASPNFHLHHS